MKATWTVLVHGPSGVGKSWLADTVPAPRLILDAEGRAKYTPSGPKILWDPRVSGPPVYDGTWETCIVQITDFETLLLVFSWLRAGDHPFVSVVIDSLMECQKRCIDSVAGTNPMQTQDWGTLLRKVEALVRTFRDLTLIESNPVCVVVMVCGTRTNDKTGRQEPLLQGQFGLTVPYYMDTVSYYFKQPMSDGTHVRAMLVDELPGFVAKDGTGRFIETYGPVIYADPNLGRPNLSALYELLRVNGGATQGYQLAPVNTEGVASVG